MAIAIAGLGLAGGALTACGDGSGGAAAGPAAGGRLRVVATTTQAGDFTRVIGADRVQVTQLIKPNVDPHDYEPSPADLDALSNADVLVDNGVGLESWLDDAVSASGFHGTKVVMADGVRIRAHVDGATADGPATASGSGGGGAPGDPHIWQNPRNAKIMVTGVERGLATADPAHAAEYGASLTAYDRSLDELDRYVQTQVATIPPAARKLVTNHDAFGYYTDRYGLTYVGSIIPSFDTSAELSGRAVSEIVAKIRDTGVRAVFSEASLPPRTAETIGREAGVKVVAGEDSLYADSLGPAGSAGATYLQAVRHNTDVIVGALR